MYKTIGKISPQFVSDKPDKLFTGFVLTGSCVPEGNLIYSLVKGESDV